MPQRIVDTKWYEFRQTNVNGRFQLPAQFVLIEAINHNDANYRAAQHGIDSDDDFRWDRVAEDSNGADDLKIDDIELNDFLEMHKDQNSSNSTPFMLIVPFDMHPHIIFHPKNKLSKAKINCLTGKDSSLRLMIEKRIHVEVKNILDEYKADRSALFFYVKSPRPGKPIQPSSKFNIFVVKMNSLGCTNEFRLTINVDEKFNINFDKWDKPNGQFSHDYYEENNAYMLEWQLAREGINGSELFEAHEKMLS